MGLGDGMFTDFEAVISAAIDVSGKTVIELDDENSITLKGLSIADLYVDDFQFI